MNQEKYEFGTVRNYLFDKKYGFIQMADGSNIFFHLSAHVDLFVSSGEIKSQFSAPDFEPFIGDTLFFVKQSTIKGVSAFVWGYEDDLAFALSLQRREKTKTERVKVDQNRTIFSKGQKQRYDRYRSHQSFHHRDGGPTGSQQPQQEQAKQKSERVKSQFEGKTWREIFGFGQFERISQDQIKSVYRRMVSKYHPDRQPEEMKALANADMAEINRARSQAELVC